LTLWLAIEVPTITHTGLDCQVITSKQAAVGLNLYSLQGSDDLYLAIGQCSKGGRMLNDKQIMTSALLSEYVGLPCSRAISSDLFPNCPPCTGKLFIPEFKFMGVTF
jgi:hypothetical protein